jgi:hypothetical protein
MGDEICGVRDLIEEGGRRTYAFRLGEWFTPCRWNNNTCHKEASPSQGAWGRAEALGSAPKRFACATGRWHGSRLLLTGLPPPQPCPTPPSPQWARRAFHARRGGASAGGAPGAEPRPAAGAASEAGAPSEAAPAPVLGMHMYASSWTDDSSATALRMREQAKEVGTDGPPLARRPCRRPAQGACASPGCPRFLQPT